MTEQELFDELKKIDTPTITNVVATYPGRPHCLEIYNPWSENWSMACPITPTKAIAG